MQMKSKVRRPDGTTKDIVATAIQGPVLTQEQKDRAVAEQFEANLAKQTPGKKEPARPDSK